jgi:hypothetical protein
MLEARKVPDSNNFGRDGKVEHVLAHPGILKEYGQKSSCVVCFDRINHIPIAALAYRCYVGLFKLFRKPANGFREIRGDQLLQCGRCEYAIPMNENSPPWAAAFSDTPFLLFDPGFNCTMSDRSIECVCAAD